MREASHKFHNADFIEKMDQNPYLLGFKNGVVDFKEKCFRVGYPEDYITKSTKMDYIQKRKLRIMMLSGKKLKSIWNSISNSRTSQLYVGPLGINTYWY